MKNKIILTKFEFDDKLHRLYRKILFSGFVPKKIVGIANGGLNISIPLSNLFSCEHVEASIHFYDEGINKIPQFSIVEKDILLVDDILDSGETIDYFIKKTNLKQNINFKIATIHYNPQGKFGLKPDYYIDLKNEEDWIVYPWES